MKSSEPVQMDTLDLLIAQSLQSRWGKAAPSPRVWRRIRRRVAARSAPIVRVWDPSPTPYFPHPMDLVFPLPFPAADSLVLRRYDFAFPRFA